MAVPSVPLCTHDAYLHAPHRNAHHNTVLGNGSSSWLKGTLWLSPPHPLWNVPMWSSIPFQCVIGLYQARGKHKRFFLRLFLRLFCFCKNIGLFHFSPFFCLIFNFCLIFFRYGKIPTEFFSENSFLSIFLIVLASKRHVCRIRMFTKSN